MISSVKSLVCKITGQKSLPAFYKQQRGTEWDSTLKLALKCVNHFFQSQLSIYEILSLKILQDDCRILWIFCPLNLIKMFSDSNIPTCARCRSDWWRLLCTLICTHIKVIWGLMMQGILWMFKMLYQIGPDGLVNRRFIDFQKMVWMATVCIIHINAVFFFWKFAYPQFTRYAEYIRFCHKVHLKLFWRFT